MMPITPAVTTSTANDRFFISSRLSATADRLTAGFSAEGSPAPAFEWPAMLELFGTDRVAELVGVSVASLRRYSAGQRPTPDSAMRRCIWVKPATTPLSPLIIAFAMPAS